MLDTGSPYSSRRRSSEARLQLSKSVAAGASALPPSVHNDHAIIELIEEIGLSDELKWFPSRVGTYASGRVYRTTTPLDLLRFGALPLYDRIKLGLFALRLREIGGLALARVVHGR